MGGYLIFDLVFLKKCEFINICQLLFGGDGGGGGESVGKLKRCALNLSYNKLEFFRFVSFRDPTEDDAGLRPFA